MKHFISILLCIFCFLPCFAAGKKGTEIDVSGNVFISGNEPHTFIVFKTLEDETYTLITDKKDNSALRATQGNIISIHGLFTAFEEEKPLPPDAAGLGYLEVVSWTMETELKEIEKPKAISEEYIKPHN